MKKGKATVFRFNPEIDIKPYYVTYEFPYELGMSVLDVALYINEKIDETFSFSYNCKNSHCGLCAAKINGKPGLMCREIATREISLEPIDNFTVIRDLMVERKEFESRKNNLSLFVERMYEHDNIIESETTNLEDLQGFAVTSRCVECFSCISVCPAIKENQYEFLGPAGMVQLARYEFHPRDDLNRGIIAYDRSLPT